MLVSLFCVVVFTYFDQTPKPLPKPNTAPRPEVAPKADSAQPAEMMVKVTGIDDGDSFRVELKSKTYRVRVAGIDCPEYKQSYSRRAHDFTADLIYDKTVKLRVVDRDQYGRIVADVIMSDGRSLGPELLAKGLAWWYRQIQPTNKTYENLEAQARAAKRGLWADKNPIPPWQWRRERDGSGGLRQRKAG